MSDLNRNHQTAVFVRTADATANFKERAARLVESLNRSGSSPSGSIKADVYSVDAAGRVTAGLNFAAPVVDSNDDDLVAAARQAGYNQAVVVTDPNA